MRKAGAIFCDIGEDVSWAASKTVVNPEYKRWLENARSAKFSGQRPPQRLPCWFINNGQYVIPRNLPGAPEPQEYGDPVMSLITGQTTVTLRGYQAMAVRDALEAGEDGAGIVMPCVAGDTVVNVNRAGKGMKIPIADLYEKFHAGRFNQSIPTMIRSFDGARVRLHKVLDVLLTGVRQTVTVVLADGKTIRVTPEHQIMTENGWVKAVSLSKGVRVAVDSGQRKWGKKDRSDAKPVVAYKRLSWYDSHPFAHKNGSLGGSTPDLPGWCLEEHRAVAEAALNKMDLAAFRTRCKNGDVAELAFIDPNVFHVHHINHDRLDNRPENLEVLSVAEHCREHGDDANFGYGAVIYVEVESVGDGKVEPVYDIRCDDPHHNFVANGIVVHNCGGGKTACALAYIAAVGYRAIVLVHTKDLAVQWLDRIATQTTYRGTMWGDGECDLSGDIVVAITQSVSRYELSEIEEMTKEFSVAVVDEAHRTPADMFMYSIAGIRAPFRLWLSATPKREDGRTDLLFWTMGPIRAEVTHQELQANGDVMQCDVLMEPTGCALGPVWQVQTWSSFDRRWEQAVTGLTAVESDEIVSNLLDADGNMERSPRRIQDESWNGLLIGLSRIEARNKKLMSIVSGLDGDGRHTLAIGDRVDHLTQLHVESLRSGIRAGLCHGKLKKRERTAALGMAASGEVTTLFASNVADEGLDLPCLDAAVFLLPCTNRRQIQQRSGRIVRPMAGKRVPLVVFPVDDGLLNVARKAASIMRKIGARSVTWR